MTVPTVKELTLTDTTTRSDTSGPVRPQGDHHASGEPAEGTVQPQGDHHASGEPKAPGHVPERGDARDGDVETEDDHHASGEPKDKPGPVAPVDHYAS